MWALAFTVALATTGTHLLLLPLLRLVAWVVYRLRWMFFTLLVVGIVNSGYAIYSMLQNWVTTAAIIAGVPTGFNSEGEPWWHSMGWGEKLASVLEAFD